MVSSTRVVKSSLAGGMRQQFDVPSTGSRSKALGSGAVQKFVPGLHLFGEKRVRGGFIPTPTFLDY